VIWFWSLGITIELIGKPAIDQSMNESGLTFLLVGMVCYFGWGVVVGCAATEQFHGHDWSASWVDDV
jgi:hypothetical protein